MRKDVQNFLTYLRVSTDKQGVFGLGMEAQRQAVTRYAEGRGTILAEYVEVETGKRSDRPQLMAALAECRRYRATLIIAKLDRLARNVHFISGLMNSDVEFVAVDMPTANRLTIHILAAVAEHEREMISQRTKAALAAAKARGVKLGNPRALEALVKARAARHVSVIPRDVEHLMSEWRADGLTLRSIAAKLNGLNITSACGSLWYASTVSVALDRFHESQKTRNAESTKERKPEIGLSLNADYSRLNERKTPTMPCFTASNAGREAIKQGHCMFDLAEAYKMLDTFVGSGATGFDVTFLDIDGEKRGFRAAQTARQLRSSLPQLVPGLQERQQNIIVRPRSDKVTFVQLDDLPRERIDVLAPVACLTLETSPGNHQAWIAMSDLPAGEEGKDFARRLRKGVWADLNASGATRVAGTPNFKVKYQPDFPIVRIIHSAPGRMVTQAQLEGLGLVAAPEPFHIANATPFRVSSAGRQWPDYQRCILGAPMKHGENKPDISRADFFWCMMSAQRGFGTEEIASQLMELSNKAQENGPRYAQLTAENGAAAAERGKQRSRA
jgi:DNA invertase Pin-like site-specific DNA recombinase